MAKLADARDLRKTGPFPRYGIGWVYCSFGVSITLGGNSTDQKIEHVANGKEYEIRSIPTEDGIVVGIFHNGMRIGPKYSVTFETAHDFSLYTGGSALETLIDLAKTDLDRGYVR